MALQLLNEDAQITVRDSEITDDGDPNTTYTLRKLTPEKQREIRKRNTRPGNYKRQEWVNWDGVQDDQLDYALVAWTGVQDLGQDVPCERPFKLRLDLVRRNALLDRAGLAEAGAAEEARADSFRQPS